MQDALIACRFLHFWSVLMLFGLCVLPYLLMHSSSDRAVSQALVARSIIGLACLSLLSALGWLLLTGVGMAGSWAQGASVDTVWLVLGHTSFGKVWIWHLALNALLIVMLLKAGWHLARLTLATFLLVTLAPTGHVAMFDGLFGQLMIVNQLTHLGAVGAWLGGLAMLLMLIRRTEPSEMRATLLRFSGLGYAMVALIIATGLVNVRAMTGALWPVPAFTGFGLILGIKLCMVLAMLMLALFNRWLLGRNEWRVGALQISIVFESAFGIAALLAVSLLGTLPPTLGG